jgi:CHAT domain-containing protein
LADAAAGGVEDGVGDGGCDAAHHPDTRLLLDEHATISSVLAALPEATWAHFACHASADPTVPSRGGFALHDATLAIPEISQLQLGHAELAYLSACSTANRGLRLPDESLHLASAFQLAGFRHVIIAAVGDADAPVIRNGKTRDLRWVLLAVIE